MSYELNGNGTGQTAFPTWEKQNYYEYCFNRLPCGYCRILEKPCPMMGNNIQVTWACSKGDDT